jgi:hypothetical protein
MSSSATSSDGGNSACNSVRGGSRDSACNSVRGGSIHGVRGGSIHGVRGSIGLLVPVGLRLGDLKQIVTLLLRLLRHREIYLLSNSSFCYI